MVVFGNSSGNGRGNNYFGGGRHHCRPDAILPVYASSARLVPLLRQFPLFLGTMIVIQLLLVLALHQALSSRTTVMYYFVASVTAGIEYR
jgi:hypothetical protein